MCYREFECGAAATPVLPRPPKTNRKHLVRHANLVGGLLDLLDRHREVALGHNAHNEIGVVLDHAQDVDAVKTVLELPRPVTCVPLPKPLCNAK